MLPHRRSYLLTLGAVFGVFSALILAWNAGLWVQLDAGEQAAFRSVLQRRPGYVVVLPLLLLAGAAAVLQRVYRDYLRPLKRLREETRLLLSANPGHRLRVAGAADILRLGEAINELAARAEGRLGEVEAQVQAARAALEEERNRLAALVAELPDAVLVCTREGRILLYNQRARQVLEAAGGGEAVVGLGRSLYGVLQPETVKHALDAICLRRAQGSPHLLARFLASSPAGALVRVRLSPLRGTHGEVDGFVLLLEDATHGVARERGRDELLRALTEGLRAPLANLRSAIETVDAFPAMDTARRHRLEQVALVEAGELSRRLQAAAHAAALLPEGWALDEVRGPDLLAALRHEIAAAGIEAATGAEDGTALWLRVESFALLQAVRHLALRSAAECAADPLELTLRPAAARFAWLELSWEGAAPLPEALRAWEGEPLEAGGSGALTVRRVVERHGGELWAEADARTGRARLRLALPVAEEGAGVPAPGAPGSRPEFYDFALFRRTAAPPELGERPLRELACTVFDTETTGLDPSGGDEIVSLAAVRIVNGRLLRGELFDTLVDPRRAVPAEAAAVHGLTAEMLAGAPTIAEVLPRFHRFAEDTVLVAHNAAFDLRFLQLKEAATGLRFGHPVLDTLLLSVVAQPEQDDHSLEAIARRLGVEVAGRHTALGDALVTGEVFLRLLPLLEEKGVRTLADALAASAATAEARLRY